MQSLGAAVRWRGYLGLAAVAGARRRLPGHSGSVALTFDDGPHPASTPAVLDALDILDVQATFFCVGANAARHPALLRRIANSGHVVGSHSQTHRIGGLSAERALADYAQGRATIEQVLGRSVPLFRPPHGHLGVGVAVGLRRSGMQTWLWDLDPADYRPGVSTHDVVDAVRGCPSGTVVLSHDALEEAEPGAPDRSVVVEALSAVVADVRKRGLSFATLG